MAGHSPNQTAAVAVQVCIVSEVFVQRFLNGRNPLGVRVAVPAMAFPMRPVLREIVGVTTADKMWPNEPSTDPATLRADRAELLVQRVAHRETAERAPRRHCCRQCRPLWLEWTRSSPSPACERSMLVAAEATSRPRFRAVLVGTFAALALGLAMVGVFGLLAYSVQQRVREFGVRIAMGAATSDVMRLVLGNAAKLTLIGLVIGLAGAARSVAIVTTLVYPVRPLDPVTFVAVPIVLRHYRRNRGGGTGMARGTSGSGGGISKSSREQLFGVSLLL